MNQIIIYVYVEQPNLHQINPMFGHKILELIQNLRRHFLTFEDFNTRWINDQNNVHQIWQGYAKQLRVHVN